MNDDTLQAPASEASLRALAFIISALPSHTHSCCQQSFLKCCHWLLKDFFVLKGESFWMWVAEEHAFICSFLNFRFNVQSFPHHAFRKQIFLELLLCANYHSRCFEGTVINVIEEVLILEVFSSRKIVNKNRVSILDHENFFLYWSHSTLFFSIANFCTWLWCRSDVLYGLYLGLYAQYQAPCML